MTRRHVGWAIGLFCNIAMAVACSSERGTAATAGTADTASDASPAETVDMAEDGTAADTADGKETAADADEFDASAADSEGDALPPDGALSDGLVDGSPDGSDASDAGQGDGTAADAASDVSSATAGPCPERAKIIYFVTSDRKLFSFNPPTLQTQLVGKISCPGQSGGSVFSMAVDRNATAWVLFNDGALYEVSTLDASCKATSFVAGQPPFDVFGMAFSADGPAATSEHLFIVGGGANGFVPGPNLLATIEFPSLQIQPVAKLLPVSSGADLSGNGNGGLWGFFADTLPPSVRPIDKVTAATGSAWTLIGNDFKDITSWAFASWDGDFYLFARTAKQGSSTVHRLAPATGVATKVINALGVTVTGAGVSSCAPTGLQP